MPSNTLSDAFYTPIGGIPYSVRRHLHHSCKASEQVLEGIPMNVPLVLLTRDGNPGMFIPDTPGRQAPACAHNKKNFRSSSFKMGSIDKALLSRGNVTKIVISDSEKISIKFLINKKIPKIL